MKECNNVLIEAHKHSINNKEELSKSKVCGCFYCLKTFAYNEINKWINDKEVTAVCPYCGVDSIIGDYSNYKIDNDFLKEMNEYWFKK